jgi:ABC-type glycerol-3-phosphate transport system permease component
MKPRTRNFLEQLFTLHIPLAPFILFSLFPFYCMAVTSVKSDGELYDLTAIPFLIQRGATLEHYQLLLRDTLFLTWLCNSILVSVLATGISIVIAILAVYSLARLRFRGAPSFGMWCSSPTWCRRPCSFCHWHRGDIFYWGSLMAGAILGSIPIVLVYVVCMDYYVSGLTQGAVK